MISRVTPPILMSICTAVTPSEVPATLKSMSPRWSSSPRMSESTRMSSPSRIRPMAMPATGPLIGTPASMRASELPHTVAIDDEPFDSRISETTRIGVRELGLVGQHGRDRALGERSVTDFAPSGAAEELHLADAERRKIVVQHELLVDLAAEQAVDPLLVGGRAERRDHERLRLAAREERRAVGPRQHLHLTGDRADVREPAAVDAPLRC